MRTIRDIQSRLKFYKSESKLSKKLEKVSEILDRDTSFLEKIAQDFKTKKGSKAGVKGMTVEQTVRAAIIKQMYQLGYKRLYDELNDNLSYRSFIKIHEGKAPKLMTLNDNIKKISPGGWEEINKVIVKTAMELGIEKGKRARMDSTGVESNIHYPTDGGFASKENYDYAVGEGIKKVLFTKNISSKMVELVKTSRVYKKLKKFRAGIEGCISAGKRAYGLSRCTWKGWRSFQSYVWLSVIAFNLNILAEALLK